MPWMPVFGTVLIVALAFATAQEAMLDDSRPQYAAYTVDVAFSNNGQHVSDSWQTIEDIGHATVLTGIFSRQEIANPSAPHGFNIAIQGLGTINPVKPRDPIGVVSFAIDQTYGVAPQHAYDVVSNRSDFYGTSRTLTIIGGTSKLIRRYDIQLIDTVAGDQGAEYHLKLTPLVNPGRDRLRELWIGTDTLAIHSAVVAGIGDRPPTTKIVWKVDFAPRDGATYLSRESALAPLNYGKQGLLQNVTIALDDVLLSSTFPGSTFGMSSPVNPVGDP